MSDAPSSQNSPGRATSREWITSIAWTAGGKWGAQLFSWLSTFIVARLLSPDDFGLMAMTSVFLGLMTLMAEAGIGSAVLNAVQVGAVQLRQVHTLALVLGVAAMALVAACSWLVAAFYGRPELALLVCVMALPLALSGLRAVPAALLQKALRFKALSVMETAQSLTQAGVTLLCAWYGLGYWSLAAGVLAGSLTATTIITSLQHVGFARPQKSDVAPLVSFSARMLVSNLCWFIYSNADFVIAGKLLGGVALGHYTIAWNLAIAPSDKLGAVVTRVVPAFLARHAAAAEAISADLCRLTKGLSLAVPPLGVGLALTADSLVYLALGSKWAPAIAPLRILAVYLALSSLIPILAYSAISAGRPDIYLRASILKLVTLLPAFYVGSAWGAQGIALAWPLVGLPTTIPMLLMVCRALRLPVRQYLRSVRTSFVSCLAMCVCVLAVKAALPASVPPLLRLVVEVFAGATVYIAIVSWAEPVLRRKAMASIWQILDRSRRMTRPPVLTP